MFFLTNLTFEEVPLPASEIFVQSFLDEFLTIIDSRSVNCNIHLMVNHVLHRVSLFVEVMLKMWFYRRNMDSPSTSGVCPGREPSPQPLWSCGPSSKSPDVREVMLKIVASNSGHLCGAAV